MWIHRAKALHLPRLKYGYHATSLASPKDLDQSSSFSSSGGIPFPVTWESRYSSLLHRTVSEREWFEEFDFPAQRQRCGVDSVIISLQRIYLSQLRSSWCPFVFRLLDDDRLDCLQHLSNLGLPAPPKFDEEVYKVRGLDPSLPLTSLLSLQLRPQESDLPSGKAKEYDELKEEKFHSFLEFFSTTSRHLMEVSLPSLRTKYGFSILLPFLEKIRTFSNSSPPPHPAHLVNCLSPNRSVDQYLESLCTTLENECDSLITRCPPSPFPNSPLSF
jgi:hypothetical protein